MRLKFIAERAPTIQLDALRMLLQEVCCHVRLPCEGLAASVSATRAFHIYFCASLCGLVLTDALSLLCRCALQVKSGKNTTLYKEVVEMIGDKLGNVLDPQWLERTQEQNEKQADKLDVDLCQHKLNSIKEKVRMGHNDLGNHHYAVGNLNEALKCFMRTRDYVTSTKHTVDMCLSIIRVSVEMGNFSHVINYVTKAEQQPEQPTDLSVVAKLRAAAGLAHLDGCKYKQAALKFTQMKIEVGKENNQPIIKNIHPDELCYSEVMAPQDVAIYGGLCALATFDRTELASKVIRVPSTFSPPLDFSIACAAFVRRPVPGRNDLCAIRSRSDTRAGDGG